MSGFALLLTTVGDRAEAERIADALVAERLAACVQIEAIRSVYRWRGKIERAEEYRLQIKTTAALSAATEARIMALHSYDLPEIVRIGIEGSAAYLAWIASETTAP